ncbi:hypothetical protein NL676_006696 [Syzygium grande]|nr:hypothetical protein NL676_006696 [Syzygium grande]
MLTVVYHPEIMTNQKLTYKGYSVTKPDPTQLDRTQLGRNTKKPSPSPGTMGFFDLNIPYDASSSPSDKANRVRIVAKAMELGYDGVTHKRSMRGRYIIAIDVSRKLPFRLKHPMVRTAIEKKQRIARNRGSRTDATAGGQASTRLTVRESFHVVAEAELPSCCFALCGVLVVCDVLPGVDRLFVPRRFYPLCHFFYKRPRKVMLDVAVARASPGTWPSSAEVTQPQPDGGEWHALPRPSPLQRSCEPGRAWLVGRTGPAYFVLRGIARGVMMDMPRNKLAQEEKTPLAKPKGTVKTIECPDTGETIHCVDILRQPSYDLPLLKNHILQIKPKSSRKSYEALVSEGKKYLYLQFSILKSFANEYQYSVVKLLEHCMDIEWQRGFP